MKILQTCVRFPPAPGGAETHVLEISKLLHARNYDVTVYTSDLYKEIPFTRMKSWSPTVQGIPVKRFKAHTMPGELHYIFIPRLAKAILKAEADIIHAHSYGYFQVNISGLNKRLRDTPFVFTPHFHPPWSMWGGERRKKIRNVYDKLFGKPVLDVADIIICHTENEVKLLTPYKVDRDKIRIIPAGIDFSEFETIPDGKSFREKYGLEGEIILFSGRLMSNKGLNVLVDAMPRVMQEYKGVKFVLVGEDHGMKAELIKQAKRLGVMKNILFTGHIKDINLFRNAYGAADVYVLPSDYEAFGLVLLEAMAAEKPCIATRVGGIPSVVEDGKTGILVDYGDPDQLSEAIITLLHDNEKKIKMGKAGRERVKKNFTWEKVVNKLEKVYSEVVSDKP